ncbi:hypothetical protein GCM10027037_11370 [Mucilaginibacter koreensis]
MNIKRTIINTLFVLGLGSIFTGCLPEKADKALVYKGPTVVEIKNQTLGMNATKLLNTRGIYTTTQTDSSRTVLIGSRGTDSILVQLVGPQSSTPIDIAYTLRPVSTALNAVEGVNFNFVPNGARKITIPANSSFGYILVNMIPGSIPVAETSRALAVDLIGNDQVKANPNYSKFILTLRRAQ